MRFERIGRYKVADVKYRGGAGLLLGINELVWRAMTQQKRAILYDRTILLADATRNDEWAVRIYLYLASRWSMNWQGHKLWEANGRDTYRLGAVLDGAGVDYQRQLSAKGGTWLRQRAKAVIQQLKSPSFTDHQLLASVRYTARQTVLDDRITLAPTADIVAELNHYRMKLAIYFTHVTPTCCGRGSPWKVSGVEPQLVRRRFDGPGDSMERTAAHHGRTRRTPGLEAS